MTKIGANLLLVSENQAETKSFGFGSKTRFLVLFGYFEIESCGNRRESREEFVYLWREDGVFEIKTLKRQKDGYGKDVWPGTYGMVEDVVLHARMDGL